MVTIPNLAGFVHLHFAFRSGLNQSAEPLRLANQDYQFQLDRRRRRRLLLLLDRLLLARLLLDRLLRVGSPVVVVDCYPGCVFLRDCD